MNSQREGNELTPAIFTKKTNFVPRQTKNMQVWMIGFENYLNMNFNIRDMLIIPGENRDVVVQNALNIVPNGEKKKRGRKNASKTATKDSYSQSTNDDSSQKKPANVSNSNNTTTHHGRRGRPSIHHDNKKNESSEYNFSKEEIQLSILDHLVNPLKTDYPFELWSPKEIAIFESAICKFGKQFGFISSLVNNYNPIQITISKIGTKTHRDVFEFYLIWKGTSHYKTWKMHKNIGNRNNNSHLI